jgi:hypothetical protein
MLLFVYNADSGKLNALLDSAHKIVSPSTYNCQLCQLTYGLMNEKAAWKQFREQLDEEVTFLHRDEYKKQYNEQHAYPFLARADNDGLEILLSAIDLAEIQSTDDLISRIQQVI